ncbi:MAG: YeeE/YedE family protein, partial [Bacteroidota bacterium]|nr:YeeE/YedE family protein [Bacteroidota bacterium]
EENGWKIFFVGGSALGAFIASHFLSSATVHFLPDKYYSAAGYAKLFIGGLLVGFGTRYANGCTSGHTIFGLSILQTSSLKATISFFAGGLIYTFFAYHF